MPALQLDFARARRPASAAGRALLAAGVLALAAVAALHGHEWQALQAARAAADARAQAAARTPPPRPLPPPAPEALATATRASAALARPWGRWLRDLELAHGAPGGASVALVSLDARGDTRSARLVAEARSMDAAVDYIERLRRSVGAPTVVLGQHELRGDGPVPLLRFTADIAWPATP
jgi:hypothetical protein